MSSLRYALIVDIVRSREVPDRAEADRAIGVIADLYSRFGRRTG